LNPDDWFRVEVYTAALTEESKPSRSSTANVPATATDNSVPYPEITWSCRVAGVKCPASRLDPYILLAALSGSAPTDPLEASISAYSGWSVYFIVAFTVLNLIVLILLAKQTGLVRLRQTAQLILFAFAVFLSMACAEVLADWIFHENSLKTQPTAASVLLITDIIAILLLAFVGTAIHRKSSPSVDDLQQAVPTVEQQTKDG
jgi:hypothetical protein